MLMWGRGGKMILRECKSLRPNSMPLSEKVKPEIGISSKEHRIWKC